MEIWELAVYAVTALIVSVLSAIAGSGGGFVLTPLAILFGLSPAQAVSTGKLLGLTVAAGSLAGMGEVRYSVSKRRVIPVLILALVIGLIAPFIIRSLRSDVYLVVLGVILLLMAPMVVFKKVGLERKDTKRPHRVAGGFLLSLAMMLQAVFGGGLDSLVNIVLMSMMGMDATEANVTKRWAQIVMCLAIIFSLIGSGLIVWQLAMAGMCGSLLGSFVGGRLAIKRGNAFIMHVSVVLMVISGITLILSA